MNRKVFGTHNQHDNKEAAVPQNSNIKKKLIFLLVYHRHYSITEIYRSY